MSSKTATFTNGQLIHEASIMVPRYEIDQIDQWEIERDLEVRRVEKQLWSYHSRWKGAR